MKKKVLIVSALMISVFSFAQEGGDEVVKNKKGHEILPKQGDIALGFNAVPAFDLILNTLRYVSIMGNSAPAAVNQAANTVQYTSNQNNMIYGKYFLDAKTAIRVRIGLNTLSGSIINPVQDAIAMDAAQKSGTPDDINAAALIKVEDKLSFRKANSAITVGYEKRRGYRRLQGFYGGELGFGRTNSWEKVEYGNDFSDVYASSYTTNFNALTTATLNPVTVGAARVSRNLSREYNPGWRFGLRGFVGVEYFVFSKISIGAEFGWGYSFSRQVGRVDNNEVYFNGQAGGVVVEEEVPVSGTTKNRGFAVDNNNNTGFSLNNTLNGNTSLSGGSGAIVLLFHF